MASFRRVLASDLGAKLPAPQPANPRFIDLGPQSDTGLIIPVGIAVDSEDNIYIAASVRGTIEKYDPDGDYVGTFAAGLQGPRFIEFDAADNLFVAERFAGRVVMITPSGAIQTVASSISPGPLGLGRGTTSAMAYRGKI